MELTGGVALYPGPDPYAYLVHTRLKQVGLPWSRGYQDQERQSHGWPGSVNRQRLAGSVAGLSISELPRLPTVGSWFSSL